MGITATHRDEGFSGTDSFSYRTSDVTGGEHTLLNFGSSWRYLDDGSDQGTAWRAPGYNDAAWAGGTAELGYGEGDEVTEIGYGPDAAHKYATTYFRTDFDLASIGPLRFDGQRAARRCRRSLLQRRRSLSRS